MKKYVQELYANVEITDEKMEELMKTWNDSKKNLRNLFLNGASKISKKFSYYMSKREIEDEMIMILRATMYPWDRPNYDVYEIQKTFFSMINEMNVENEPIGIFLRKNRVKGINSIKITKYLKEWTLKHKVDYETFLKKYSMLLQKCQIEDTLYISTLPEDIITLSVNTNNWRSCMSLDSTYSYRVGLIEYLNNPNIMIAYLKSSTELSKGIDNKKWRMIIDIKETEDDYQFNMRKSYPDRKIGLEDIIIDYLGITEDESNEKNQLVFYYNFAYEDRPYRVCKIEKTDSMLRLGEIEDYSCPFCGSSDLCECGKFGNICSICGERIDPEESRTDEDGNCYCEDCFFERFSFCEDCEEYYDADDVVYVNGRYGEAYVCPTCLRENYSICKICGEYHENRNMEEVGNEMVCQECFDNSYVYCDNCEDPIEINDAFEFEGSYYCKDCYEEVKLKAEKEE